MTLRIVSADSHMIEPANLWVDRIDNRFKDRAPRSVTKPDKPGAFFMAEGLRPFPVAAVAATGRDGEEYARHMAKEHGLFGGVPDQVQGPQYLVSLVATGARF